MALSTLTDAAGGALTADQVQKLIVRPLTAQSTFISSGVRLFNVVDAGPVHIPKLLSGVDPAWVPENVEIPTGDPTFGEVVLLDGTPKLATIVRVSNELVHSAIVDVISTVSQRLVLDLSLKMDAVMWNGPSAGAAPEGLLNYSGTQTLAAGGAPSVDLLYDALAKALVANVNPKGLRWAMTSRDLIQLRKLKASGTGEYLVQPDVTQGLGFTLLGIPVTLTNFIPIGGGAGNPSTIVLADFSTIAVAMVTPPTVSILKERYAEFHQTAIKIVMKADAAPLLPEAIVRVTGVTGPAA